MSGETPRPDSSKISLYDPAYKKLLEVLEIAKESAASPKVIQAVEESLSLYQLRQHATHDVTTKDSPTCAKIVEETFSHDWTTPFEEKKTSWNLNPRMMSGHLEGQFLKSFLSAQKAKRVLDIGMFTGFSATSIAEVLPADGEVVTLEFENYLKPLVENLIKDSPHKDKIHMAMGKALDSMASMAKDGTKFDAVFMDAAKAEYKEYLKLCLDHLLSPGGTMLIDNAYMNGALYMKPESNTAQFGEFLKSRSDLHVVLVPIRDGIYLVRRRSEVDGGNV